MLEWLFTGDIILLIELVRATDYDDDDGCGRLRYVLCRWIVFVCCCARSSFFLVKSISATSRHKSSSVR